MRKEVAEAYSPSVDITFLMEYAYNEDEELVSMECINWYYGEPNKTWTEGFSKSKQTKYVLIED